MGKSFLFVTPLTPSHLLTPLRKILFGHFLNSLKTQNYEKWQVLLIGEEEKVEGNLIWTKIKAGSKELKLAFAKEYILSMDVKPDYVIRMDDDDVINPNLLKNISQMSFDCYADAHHTFYDIVGAKVSQQHRSWLANTVVHKYQHAFTTIGKDSLPLLQADHSKDWTNYYKDKDLRFAPKGSPVYLRVLSPTTVTSGIFNSDTSEKKLSEVYGDFMAKAANYKNAGDFDLSAYSKYLSGFGKWKFKEFEEFKAIQKQLENTWTNFSGKERDDSFKDKLNRKINSWLG
jgi:hypothetical protein